MLTRVPRVFTILVSDRCLNCSLIASDTRFSHGQAAGAQEQDCGGLHCACGRPSLPAGALQRSRSSCRGREGGSNAGSAAATQQRREARSARRLRPAAPACCGSCVHKVPACRQPSADAHSLQMGAGASGMAAQAGPPAISTEAPKLSRISVGLAGNGHQWQQPPCGVAAHDATRMRTRWQLLDPGYVLPVLPRCELRSDSTGVPAAVAAICSPMHGLVILPIADRVWRGGGAALHLRCALQNSLHAKRTAAQRRSSCRCRAGCRKLRTVPPVPCLQCTRRTSSEHASSLKPPAPLQCRAGHEARPAVAPRSGRQVSLPLSCAAAARDGQPAPHGLAK